MPELQLVFVPLEVKGERKSSSIERMFKYLLSIKSHTIYVGDPWKVKVQCLRVHFHFRCGSFFPREFFASFRNKIDRAENLFYLLNYKTYFVWIAPNKFQTFFLVLILDLRKFLTVFLLFHGIFFFPFRFFSATISYTGIRLWYATMSVNRCTCFDPARASSWSTQCNGVSWRFGAHTMLIEWYWSK